MPEGLRRRRRCARGEKAEVVAEARRRSRRGRVSGARRGEAVLRSSRTAMSDDGWTRPPGSGQDGGVRRPADETDATPFPDVSPAARRHPPRQQKGHRRSKANTTEGPQQQKGLRRRCVAAKRGGEGHSNKIDTAKPPPQQQSHHRHSRATAAKKNERPIVYGRPLEFVSKTVGWDGTSPHPAPERRNQRGAWSERHQEPADSQRTSS